MKAKKVAKGAGIAALAVLGALAVVAGVVSVRGVPTYAPGNVVMEVEATPERLERGQKLVGLLCVECHADTTTGKLTGKRMLDAPPVFGEIVSKNITRHPTKGIGAWTDGQLAYFLRTGVAPDGHYAPPWMVKLPLLSDEDMASVIAYVRKSDDPRLAAADVDPPGQSKPSFVTKLLTNTAIKPLPYPSGPIATPAKTDTVAWGKYLATTYDCYGCHSADFAKVDPLVPERSAGYYGGGNTMNQADGTPITTANLTPDDETGIGRWSEADFSRAVKRGFRPDGRVLRSPMTPRSELQDDEIHAIYTYLRTIPKLHVAHDRRLAPPPADPDPGKNLYVSYGCVSCHGERGVSVDGSADLRRANDHFATDAELRAWIEDAPAKKPGTRMPGWKGVIAEADYGPLMGHVRKLARAPREASNP